MHSQSYSNMRLPQISLFESLVLVHIYPPRGCIFYASTFDIGSAVPLRKNNNILGGGRSGHVRDARRSASACAWCVCVAGLRTASKRKPSYSEWVPNGTLFYSLCYVRLQLCEYIINNIKLRNFYATGRCYFSVFNILLVNHTVKVEGIFNFQLRNR